MENYEFIDRALFFPKKGILVIGDLHIGYEAMLRQSGVLVPERQVKDIINDLKNIFEIIKEKNNILKKIVFLGDLKHAFGFEHTEKNEFRKIMEFLEEIFLEENIILIRGNHDTIDYSFEKKMKHYHIEDNIIFVHGDDIITQAFNKNVQTIVMGHLHPCVILKAGAKKEAYKCFLEGDYEGKRVIVMPSFLDIIEGTPVNDYHEDYIESFSIIPKRAILNFTVHAIGENAIFDFGKIKDLK
jgi:hypothetical protein